MIFDPPNLSKRSTKSDSRAKVTKGLFIFSPKHGRMQKFTTFYQAGFENVQNFSIFTCMFSSGWGPYPNLKVLLCEKMHDHLGGRRGPGSGVCLWSGVSLFLLCLLLIFFDFWFVCYMTVSIGQCWRLRLIAIRSCIIYFESCCWEQHVVLLLAFYEGN